VTVEEDNLERVLWVHYGKLKAVCVVC